MIHTKRLTKSTVCNKCGRSLQPGDISYLSPDNTKTFCSKNCLTHKKHT